MKLYLGNLSKEMNDASLAELVAPYGKPVTVDMAKERGTGETRGFGFVEFATDDEAKAAIAGLDGKEVNGKALKVNEARPQKPR